MMDFVYLALAIYIAAVAAWVTITIAGTIVLITVGGVL